MMEVLCPSAIRLESKERASPPTRPWARPHEMHFFHSKVGGLFEFQTPPPPDPPKVLEPVFLQFEILGEIFFAPPEGVFFLFTLCVYSQNTQNFVENSKMFEEHRKFFDP